MKSNYINLLFISLLSCFFVSCSDDDNRERIFQNGIGSELLMYWFMRTCRSKIYLVSCNYEEVATSIRNTPHAVAVLDVPSVHGQTAVINTGVETARESKRIPVFVPIDYNSGEQKLNREYHTSPYYYF